MPPSCYLGIDLGTSSVKVLVVDADGLTLATGRASYEVARPAPDRSETAPSAWWHAVQQAVRESMQRIPHEPAAIGLSGQMHGVVVCDAAGNPRRPAILWPDQRAGEIRADFEALPDPARRRLANPWSPGMAGPILAWLARHEPQVLADSRWALQPKDWLRLVLTGEAHAEPSDASGTLLYDVPGDRWDLEVAGHLDVDPDLLAPLVPSAQVTGSLVPAAAELLGLSPGIPVVAGAGDTPAAMLGNGLGGGDAAQLTLGTGGQVVALQASPRPAAEAGVHTYRAATATGWYAMAAVLNAGLALSWVCRTLGCDWETLYAAADQAILHDDPVFVPHLAGERTPYLSSELRGAWHGLGLEHDRDALLRSTLEGVAFGMRAGIDAMPGVTSNTHLRTAGGGSAHDGWRQLLADVLGAPLQLTRVTDASGRGAALLAAIGTGVLTEADTTGRLAPRSGQVTEPRTERLAIHERRRAVYRLLVADQSRYASTPEE